MKTLPRAICQDHMNLEANRKHLARTKPEETIVKSFPDDFRYLHLPGIGMFWIQQIIPGLWNNRGRYSGQRRFQRRQPDVANLPREFWMPLPVGRGKCIQLLYCKIIWNRDLQQLIETRKNPVLVRVHKVNDTLQHCASRILR